jgi:Arc/MetJ-type ribon-helix-helix transcriptional regulator
MSDSKPKASFPGFSTKAKGLKIGRTTQSSNVVNARRKKAIKDTFSFPEEDYAIINEMIALYLSKGIKANKSEVIRAGLKALQAMDASEQAEAINKLNKLSVGRPKES